MNKVYNEYLKFKQKHPKTICWRAKKHAKVIEENINASENLLYVFGGQKNKKSLDIIHSCLVAITDKRMIIATKRVLWGYFYTSVTPDLYNDIKLIKNLIWSDIEIDTVRENIYISNIDPKGAIEIETAISEFMIKEKKKYGKKEK